ncbi:MAG: DUF4136 domain-containing protein [Alphaproteobacteria bacterium]|nr:DUF4136 domain-containing protein [Alphaproteobacteria bacterium]
MIARRLFIASALPLLAGLSLRPGEATAQQPQPGRVTARSFDPVAAGATIEVSPLDDRQENQRLAAEFRRRLSAAGYRMGDAGAALRLSFDSEVRPLGGGSPARREGGERGAGSLPGGSDPTPDRPVRRGQDPSAGAQPSGLRYVINGQLDERAAGKRVWQGNVRYDDVEGDRTRMLLRLVPQLVGVFGRTERGRGFALE